MSFINSNKIGIGTNPNYHLDVSGNSHVSGNSYTLGNVGIGNTTPSYTLDVSGNGRFNGALYSSGVSTMLKQISTQLYHGTLSVNTPYQNIQSTPMFVTAVVVGSNTSYGVNSDSSTNPTTQIFNQTLAGGNGYCFFIVMPYCYFKFTSNISLGQVYYYY